MSPAPNLRTCKAGPERRRHRRFPIATRAEYVLRDRRGETVTSNISSDAVLVQSADVLRIGESVELRVDWPVLLEGRCPLRLIITGKVLGRAARGTIIRIVRYEYRLATKPLAKAG